MPNTTMDEILMLINQNMDEIEEAIKTNPGLVTVRDDNQRSILHWAALQAKEDLVNHLISFNQSELDAEDDTGTTPLLLATLKGNLNIVRSIHKKGADINKKNWRGHSCIQYACSRGYKDIVLYLLSNGADVNAQDGRGDTALHRLASLGRVEILTSFLNHSTKPDLDLQNSEGNTALHIACEDDQKTCALLLVEHKASVTILNKEKKTPIDLCKPGLRQSIAEKST